MGILSRTRGTNRFLRLVEQPGVLDGDHGLVGEGLEQLDVMRCERPWLPSRDGDHADHRPATDEGCERNTAEAARAPKLLAELIRSFSIGYLDRRTAANGFINEILAHWSRERSLQCQVRCRIGGCERSQMLQAIDE